MQTAYSYICIGKTGDWRWEQHYGYSFLPKKNTTKQTSISSGANERPSREGACDCGSINYLRTSVSVRFHLTSYGLLFT